MVLPFSSRALRAQVTATGLQLVGTVESAHGDDDITALAADLTTGTVVSGGDDKALKVWKVTAAGLELVGTVEAAHGDQ